MDDCTVYLVPIGSGAFDLYNEVVEDADRELPYDGPEGFWRRRARRLHEGWQEISRAASATRGVEAGRFARLRNWLVRRIAESIAEQRTLWSLRSLTSASLVYPSDLSATSAAATRDRLLAHARSHHGLWLAMNVVGVAVTAILVLLPGPNLIGYYFAFRVVGHYLCWRGARQALERVSWQPIAEPALAELGALVRLPREERAERVSAIASRLGLRRLEAFFDRVAAPER